MQHIERETIVKWDIEFGNIDPQYLQSMGEKAVRNVVDKIRESVVWVWGLGLAVRNTHYAYSFTVP
jgi:hypothetical protein